MKIFWSWVTESSAVSVMPREWTAQLDSAVGAYSLRKLFCSREVNETPGRQNQNLALTPYTESETVSALISIFRQSAPPHTHTPYLCTASCGTKAKANDQVDLLSPLRSTIDGSPEFRSDRTGTYVPLLASLSLLQRLWSLLAGIHASYCCQDWLPGKHI